MEHQLCWHIFPGDAGSLERIDKPLPEICTTPRDVLCVSQACQMEHQLYEHFFPGDAAAGGEGGSLEVTCLAQSSAPTVRTPRCCIENFGCCASFASHLLYCSCSLTDVIQI